MKHIIVTGHSRGLGAGITRELLGTQHHIHGISRTDSLEIQKQAVANDFKFNFYGCDLSHSESISHVMEQVFYTISGSEAPHGLYLINNAGIIHPIGPVETLSPEDMEMHLKVNLLAPMLLIREFIRHAEAYRVEKRVISISSGAAVNPYHGLSMYCSGKAGLDMFTRNCALEQQYQSYPVEFMSVAPGVIDTDMQTAMRQVPEEKFKNKQKFVALKEKGELIAPEVAGRRLIDLLFSPEFETGGITDLRNKY
jgi:benzil reductase ((S)-benzoin forming)